jgi:hypothetical protein
LMIELADDPTLRLLQQLKGSSTWWGTLHAAAGGAAAGPLPLTLRQQLPGAGPPGRRARRRPARGRPADLRGVAEGAKARDC